MRNRCKQTIAIAWYLMHFACSRFEHQKIHLTAVATLLKLLNSGSSLTVSIHKNSSVSQFLQMATYVLVHQPQKQLLRSDTGTIPHSITYTSRRYVRVDDVTLAFARDHCSRYYGRNNTKTPTSADDHGLEPSRFTF